METLSLDKTLALPATPAPPTEEARPGTSNLLDLVLHGERRLTALLLDERSQLDTLRRLVGLALLALFTYGLVVGLVDHAVSVRDGLAAGRTWLWMPLAFPGAYLGALGICLPSFYFYTLLAGLDASFRLVAAQAVRVLATTAVALLGILPFYAAAALAPLIGIGVDWGHIFILGLIAPFVVGLYGIRVLHRVFRDLAGTLPILHARRGAFLLRMVLAWGLVYSVVTPVAFVRLSVFFEHVFMVR